MSSKQIKIEDYFNIMRDDNGRVFGIQEIGDTRDLIKAIKEKNEYIQVKEQECEELQHKVNVISEALIRVNETAREVRNYLVCPTPVDVKYEILTKSKSVR